MTDHIRVHVEDGVMRIAFARPEKKNAITNSMYQLLIQVLQQAERDDRHSAGNWRHSER